MLIRYILVQTLAYLVDMSTFLICLDWINLGVIYANILSKISAGFFAFFIQRKFTFKVNTNEKIGKQASLYFIFLFINIPIASVMLFLTVQLFSESIVAKFFADILCLGISYLLSKFFIFSK